MRKRRFTEQQIMAVLRQAESGVAVPEFAGVGALTIDPGDRRGIDCSEQRDQHGELLQLAIQVWRHGCVDDEPE